MAIAGVRGMAQSYIRSSITKGVGATASWNILSEEFRRVYGVFYRKTDFLADFRTWAGVSERVAPLKAVRLDYKPSKGVFTETMPYLTRRFKYDVDITFRIPATGKVVSFSTSVSSMDWLTPGGMRSEAIEGVSMGTEYDIEVLSAVQTAAYHRPGDAWGD